jgi:hypothetical protein
MKESSIAKTNSREAFRGRMPVNVREKKTKKLESVRGKGKVHRYRPHGHDDTNENGERRNKS